MTDKELLLAISNIVQTYTNPIQQQLQDTEVKLDNKIDTVQTRLEGKINSVQAHLENRIDSVQAHLENRIDSVQAHLENRIDSVQAHLKNQISTLDTELKQTQSDVKQIQILLENDVLPRLQNIESCYTSTYQRYADNILTLETLQSDVTILKDVVTEHSELLQKIS